MSKNIPTYEATAQELTTTFLTGRFDTIDSKTRQAVLAFYQYHCQYCAGSSGKPATVIDHIIPVTPRPKDLETIQKLHVAFSIKALDSLENVTSCCQPCNANKTNKLLPLEIITPLLKAAATNKGTIEEYIRDKFGTEYREFPPQNHMTAALDALFHGARHEYWSWSEKLHNKILILIQGGADVSKLTSHRSLLWAAREDELEIVRTITSAQKFPEFYKEALWQAIDNEAPRVVKELIGRFPHEADNMLLVMAKKLKEREKTGFLRFHKRREIVEILDTLLDNKQTPDFGKMSTKHFFIYAMNHGDVIKKLVEFELTGRDRAVIELAKAAATGETTVLENMLKQSYLDLQSKNLALEYALKVRNSSSAHSLILSGADPSLNNLQALRLMVRNGAVNIKDVVALHPKLFGTQKTIFALAVQEYFRNYPGGFHAQTNLYTLLENPSFTKWQTLLPTETGRRCTEFGHRLVKRAIKSKNIKLLDRCLELGIKVDPRDEWILKAAADTNFSGLHKFMPT